MTYEGENTMKLQNYMERCVKKKIRDFVDISVPAGNINNLGKPRDLISKSAI